MYISPTRSRISRGFIKIHKLASNRLSQTTLLKINRKCLSFIDVGVPTIAWRRDLLRVCAVLWSVGVRCAVFFKIKLWFYMEIKGLYGENNQPPLCTRTVDRDTYSSWQLASSYLGLLYILIRNIATNVAPMFTRTCRLFSIVVTSSKYLGNFGHRSNLTWSFEQVFLRFTDSSKLNQFVN